MYPSSDWIYPIDLCNCLRLLTCIKIMVAENSEVAVSVAEKELVYTCEYTVISVFYCSYVIAVVKKYTSIV